MALGLCMATFVLTAILGTNAIDDYHQRPDELVSVYILYRHGDRTPLKSFPKDKYFNPINFPMGYGQLTNMGKQREFELGKWLRQRYSKFLPATYSPKDIYVHATNIDRTMMSAYCCLAGLYPPTKEQIWNSNIPWQPIPVHSTPSKLESIVTNGRPCRRYKKLLDELKTSDFFDNVNNNSSDLYSYLSKKSGWNVTDIYQAKLIWCNFYIYRHYNSTFIPRWAKKLDTDKLEYLAGLDFQRNTYNHEMKRLGAGPFFNHLFKYFNKVVSSTADTPKMLMISGGDTIVAAAMNTMGVFKPHPPKFAATLLWELMKSQNGSYYVNIFYKSGKNLEKLVVAGCDFNCNYNHFVKIMETKTVDIKTWVQECKE